MEFTGCYWRIHLLSENLMPLCSRIQISCILNHVYLELQFINCLKDLQITHLHYHTLTNLFMSRHHHSNESNSQSKTWRITLCKTKTPFLSMCIELCTTNIKRLSSFSFYDALNRFRQIEQKQMNLHKNNITNILSP